MIIKALDLGDVSLLFLNGIDVSTYCRRVMALTLCLSFTASEILLVIFILLVDLALMGGVEGESAGLVFPEFFSYFLAGLLSWGQLKSILQILEDDCSNVFASTLTAFLTASFQESRSQPRAFN